MFFGTYAFLASNTIRARGGPAQPSTPTTTSPLRPPVPRQVADRVAVVAARAGDRVDRLEHRLLVRAALGGRARVLGGDLELLLALGLELDDLVLERRDLLVERLEVGVLLLGGAPHRGHRARLEVGQRVVRVGGGELLEQVLAHPRRLLGHHRAQLVLDRDGGLGAEQPLELLGELAVLGREDVVDALAEELGDRRAPSR